MGEIYYYYEIISGLAAFGFVINTLEYLHAKHTFNHSGIYSWDILKYRFYNNGIFISKIRDVLALPSILYSVLILRFFLAFFVIFISPGSPFFIICWSFISLSCIYLRWRTFLGDDGSDQMLSILAITMSLCFLEPNNSIVLTIGLFFIGLQAILAYSTAGIAKIVSPIWRSGMAVYRVLNTKTYGNEKFATFLNEHKFLGLVLSWSVIVFEIMFLFTLVAPIQLVYALFIGAAIFHFFSAILMGLNVFIWSFIATFPAVLYVNLVIRNLLF